MNLISISGVPNPCLEWVDARARNNFRSRSAEIVMILEQARKQNPLVAPEKRRMTPKTFILTDEAEKLLNR